MRPIAITRSIPSSFAHALAAVPAPIDVELARRQHASYRAALTGLGLDVIELPADDALPDCCFVEDAAIVAAGLALVTRPGAPSRRGETAAVATALAQYLELAHVEAPATIDGGDCMHVGTTLYIGRSARTNDAGIARLAAVFEPRGLRVVPIDLPPAVLHLKCVCAPLGDNRITLADATIPHAAFGDVDVVSIPEAESYAANVLTRDGSVLVADGFPRTRDALAAAGFHVVALPTTEVRKADGALTCLSIVVG